MRDSTGAELNDRALDRCVDLYSGGERKSIAHRHHLLVGAPWIVMEQHDPLDTTMFGQRHAVFRGGVPPRPSGQQFMAGVLRIVDEHIHPRDQFDSGLMQHAETVGTRAQVVRRMVG